jgi:ferritin-like metal-binding protein YciE
MRGDARRESFRNAFVDALHDTYDAEQQLIKAALIGQQARC